MTEESQADVLICGAGAAGLTLAIDLARRGISFRLIDKLAGPFQGSRGKALQPRTLEVFEDLGVVDRLFAAGGAYPPQRAYHPDGSVTETNEFETGPPTPEEPYPTPLMAPQFLTEAVLRERLLELGRRPSFGSELIGFEQSDTDVVARLKSGLREELIRVRYLVGADGGRSFVRHALEVGFPGRTLGVRAIVADLDLTGLTRDAWHRFNQGDMVRQISFCPLMGTSMFQLQGPIPADGDIDLSADGLSRLIAARTGRSDIQVKAVHWTSAFTMNARLADQYRRGRIVLVGDAAHVHPPTGGQGLNTSVQDSYNLGWKLAAALRGAPEALLDTYEEERRPIAAEMLGLATRLLGAQGQGDTRRGREVHQLDLGYAGASLARFPTRDRGGLGAGDRAPDAQLRGAGGQAARLFELFKGPHWTLLASGTGHERAAARPGLHIHAAGEGGDLIDDQDRLRDVYGLEPGDWALIRPDGYVAAIGGVSHLKDLETYLLGVGLRRVA